MSRDTVQLEILTTDKQQLDDLTLNICEVTGIKIVSDYDVLRFAINALERELHYVTTIHVDKICDAYDKSKTLKDISSNIEVSLKTLNKG